MSLLPLRAFAAYRTVSRPPVLPHPAVILGLCLVVFGSVPAFCVRAQDHATTETARERFEAGRAHLARGDSTAAHAAWRRGIETLGAEGFFDVRLADAYLRSVFRLERTDERAAAANAYLQLIARAGDPALAASERRIVRRHVAQMVFLLPEATQAHITPDAEALMDEGAALHPEAGERLAAWWRRQDPLPASLGNERVVEHLARVAHAERRFANGRRLARFDTRGVVHVRLGAPSRIVHLDNEAVRMDGLGALSASTLAIPTVPRHAVWVYDDLGDDAVYLFVRRQHRYVRGTVRDLLPFELRGPTYSDTPLGRAKASLALRVLRDYYEQLHRLHPAYRSLLNTIETYRLRRGDEDFLGIPPPPGTGAVDRLLFARQRVHDVRRTDRRLARRRAESVPTARTETVNERNRLHVATRTARFLEDDGTTRTEVYWAVDPADLTPAPDARLRLLQQGLDMPDAYRLDVTAVRYGPGYRPQAKHRTQHTVAATDAEAPAVYSLALPGDTGRYHLALQWDQYAAPADEDAAPVFLRTGRHWDDSLRALPDAPESLVLSDLVPLRTANLDATEPVRDDRGFRVTPYPFETVTPNTELALYLEVYGLTFDADARTRYTIEYVVRRHRERGGWPALLDSEEHETTTAAASHVGTSRTAREYVLLDLSPWDDADALTVTVRITDDVSGHAAARAVSFALHP